MKPPDTILGTNLVPAPGAVFSEAEEIARLKDSLMKSIRRSAFVFRVDCGGCNGCEIEIFAAGSLAFASDDRMTPTTRFRIASLSKIVLGALAGSMIADG